MTARDHLFNFFLLIPAFPFIMLLENFGVELTDGGPVWPFFAFCAAISLVEWTIVITLSVIFGWWILGLWAFVIFLVGRWL